MSGTDRRDQTEKGERLEMGDACGSGASQCSSPDQCSSPEAGKITQDGQIWEQFLLILSLQAVVTVGWSSWCHADFWHFNSQAPPTKAEN